ncbi:hypothetical protein M0805_000367 [Coniferiporia weirii]|nr:hypothetical protein M0805_000367 [Coniferiporia weirii]
MARGSVSSIDSSSSSSDEELRLAQQEWEENLQQLQLLVSVVLLPYVGKWLGRRWAHTAYARYTRLGWGRAFLFGEGHS